MGMITETREEELLKLLRRIAVGVEQIGAAVTIEVSDEVKHETSGGSAVSEKSQAQFIAVESIREKALRALARTFEE